MSINKMKNMLIKQMLVRWRPPVCRKIFLSVHYLSGGGRFRKLATQNCYAVINAIELFFRVFGHFAPFDSPPFCQKSRWQTLICTKIFVLLYFEGKSQSSSNLVKKSHYTLIHSFKLFFHSISRHLIGQQ